MVRIGIYVWLCTFAAVVWAAPGSNHLGAQRERSVPSRENAESPQVLFQYVDGLLSGQAEQAPVADVLDALAAATGAEVVQRYTFQEDDRLSFAFPERPFREAIKEVLSGFNYVIGRLTQPGGMPTILVLGRTASPPLLAAQAGESPKPVPGKKSPWDLDAFWPLSKPAGNTAGPANGEADLELSLSREEREALEAELRRERVDRAVAALNSEHRNLYAQALEDMQGLDDPRVTATLRSGALGKLASPLDATSYARALWQHAADLEFRDDASLSALEALAASDDPHVRDIATRALADRSRYLELQTTQE